MDREFARSPSWLADAADLPVAAVEAIASHSRIEALPGTGTVDAFTTRERWAEWLEALRESLGAYHGEHPLLPGMDLELLRSQLPYSVAPRLFRAIVDRLATEKQIVREESLVRLPTHRVKLAAPERAATAEIEALLEAGTYTPPDVKQMSETLKLPPKRILELLAALEREGKAAKVSQDLFYHSSTVARLREQIAERIRARGPLGAAEFRDMIGASRKFSIALLEYFDRTGFTIRVGDERKLRRG
jgi:selenocysteine-specific elongation factor